MAFELLDAQGYIPVMKNLLEEAAVKALVKKKKNTKRGRSMWTTLQPPAGCAVR